MLGPPPVVSRTPEQYWDFLKVESRIRQIFAEGKYKRMDGRDLVFQKYISTMSKSESVKFFEVFQEKDLVGKRFGFMLGRTPNSIKNTRQLLEFSERKIKNFLEFCSRKI